MAETAAAAAAPSESAPAAQPSAGPDTTAAAIPAAPDTAQRLAKPLRPIPSLPGVFPDEDPFGPTAERATTPSSAAATRGPDGRFVATPSSSTVGEHAPQSGDQVAEPAPPTPARYKFAGEEFESQEAAEQNFKSLRGQYRPLQSLAKEVGGLDKIHPTLNRAAESARGWKGEAERLSAELNALRNGAAPAPTEAVPPTPDAPATEAVDWDLYAEIKKVANDSGEPWKAEQWLHEQQERVIATRVQRLLDERLAPLAEQEQRAAVEGQVSELFGGMMEYTNSDGSPAFPELRDPQTATEIGRLWVATGLPPESALTPQGVIAAVAMYRMAKAPRSQASPAPPAQVVAPPVPYVPTDADAAAALGDGRQREMSVGGNGTESAEAARVRLGLRSVHSTSRAHLGFDA